MRAAARKRENTGMPDAFTDQLRAQLGSIEAAISRLANQRRLIEELLSLEFADLAPSAHVEPRTRPPSSASLGSTSRADR